jgi:hypothetical protein
LALGYGFHPLTRSAAPIFQETDEDAGFPSGFASLETENLINRALRRAGRSRFSDLSFVPALDRLLKAYAEEADLSFFGRHQAFLFHRRFLQHLDTQTPGRRWILKSPDHVFCLDAIRAAYPDAVIVFLHRDPLSVVSSCARLTEHLQRPFTNRLDPKEVGRQVSARLHQAADHMMGGHFPRILHLHYREVVAQPIAAVRTLYRHCGFELSGAAEQRMTRFLARPHRRSVRTQDFSRFGLDAGALRDRFARYVRHFAVPQEARA